MTPPNKSWKQLLAPAVWRYPGHGHHAAYSLWNKHSDFYFNSDFLVRDPELLKKAAFELVELLKPKLISRPDWVITYPPYGLNIGFCVADLLGCKFGYIKSLENPELDFDVSANDSVLFCADDLPTGSSFRKVAASVEGKGARLVEPLAVIANFCGASDFDGHPVQSLIKETISIWDASNCPLCAIGSEPLQARKNWQHFCTAAKSET